MGKERVNNYIVRIATFVAMLLVCMGCDKSFNDCYDLLSDNNREDSMDGMSEVYLSASSNTTTRTSLDTDLSTVKWSVGDQVAVWATNTTTSSKTMVGEMFQLKYYSTTYDKADFASTIKEMDDSYRYRYSAFYPYTSSVNGTTVNYSIPANQSGQYDGTCDFRIADEVEGSALSESTIGGPMLSFRALTHALRISIPAGYNALGVPVQKLIFDMPANVIGDFTLDVSGTGNTPTMVRGSKQVTLDLGDNTIDAGDGKYVWLFMNETTDVTGTIEVTAQGTNLKYTEPYEIDLTNHNFVAGNITPVNLSIPEAVGLRTTIQLTQGDNNLGEEITKVTFTAPSTSAHFLESDSSSVSYDANNSGIYTVNFVNDKYGQYFAGKNITVTFESAHAKMNQTIAYSELTIDDITSVTRDVPYLMDVNFGSITAFSIDDNNATGANISAMGSGSGNASSLTNYGLTGWTGYRVGGQANTSMRVCGREQAGKKYDGRLDSAPLSGLKSSSTGVKVYVKFDYDGGEKEYKGTGFILWGHYGDPAFTYGYTKTQGDIDDDTSESGNYTYGWEEQGNSGSYTSINQDKSFEISSATSLTRLTWKAGCYKKDKLTQNGNYWLYLDNIKVSLSPITD